MRERASKSSLGGGATTDPTTYWVSKKWLIWRKTGQKVLFVLTFWAVFEKCLLFSTVRNLFSCQVCSCKLCTGGWDSGTALHFTICGIALIQVCCAGEKKENLSLRQNQSFQNPHTVFSLRFFSTWTFAHKSSSFSVFPNLFFAAYMRYPGLVGPEYQEYVFGISLLLLPYLPLARWVWGISSLYTFFSSDRSLCVPSWVLTGLPPLDRQTGE